jgi:hypothetical protein
MPDSLDRLFDTERLRRNWHNTEATANVLENNALSPARRILQDMERLVQSEAGVKSHLLSHKWKEIEQMLLQIELTPMNDKELSAQRALLQQALQQMEEMLDALLLFQSKD